MTLLRATARTLLASYFVASGYKSVRHPELLVSAAEPVTDKLVPMVKKYAPAQVAGFVPEDTQTLVRVNGVAQLVGGLALASGKGRRLGAVVLATSLVPSTLAKHPFWTRTDPLEKAEERAHFLKNVSLLGGVLLAAGDTEGRPSLVYLAHKGGESLARDTRRATKRLGKKTGVSPTALSKNAAEIVETVSKGTSQLTDGALAGGAALVSAAVAGSRKARKQASRQLKEAREAAAKEAAAAQKVRAKEAAVLDKQRAKEEAVLDKQRAKEEAVLDKQQAKEAQIAEKEQAKQSAIAEKERAKQAAEDEKITRKQIQQAAKEAERVNKNIHRGEN